ncbi:hypothetical protein NOSIN_11555 [Nocardiopsis sinuspersici]|uniref:Uncharacterized protein n=1 Tax=Nocardiopsis sinuspersici TaxID=501010 RepID=A0A1V3C143_9ACTN|nr:hypothetical protein NOSIN_11555 [Nocardiopsis sinuspersici]
MVLELDPDQANLPRLQELGYEVFTSVDSLLGFVNRLGQDAAGEADERSETEEAPTPGPRTADFGRAMVRAYERARDESGFTAPSFQGMLAEQDPVGAAHRLLSGPAVSDGFSNLWDLGRLDLTVEALVLRPEFSPLFTGEELDRARGRLEQFGYEFPRG